MRYAYYPGCSLTATAVEYDTSTRLILGKLGDELVEIPDWTCCGASTTESVSRLLSFALPARNLALAERDLVKDEQVPDVLAPCSACYLNLLKVREETRSDKNLLTDLNTALSDEGLTYERKSRVFHLLDLFADRHGRKKVEAFATHRLDGITVAPYYGCQILRPYHKFDDPERPQSMKPVLEAIGVEVLDWDMGGRCCGASLMATQKETALKSVAGILEAAQEADVIATVCPLCQMNLEAYQSQALKLTDKAKPVAVLYLPQLMGLAFGFSEKEVQLNKNLAVTNKFLSLLRDPPKDQPDPGESAAA